MNHRMKIPIEKVNKSRRVYVPFPTDKDADLILEKIDHTTYRLMSAAKARNSGETTGKNIFLYANRKRGSNFSRRTTFDPKYKEGSISVPFEPDEEIYKILSKRGLYITTDPTHIPESIFFTQSSRAL